MKHSLSFLKNLQKSMILIMFFCAFACSDKSNRAETKVIDKKIAEADSLYMNTKYRNLLKVSNEIKSLSEKINYEKGRSYGEFYTAECLFNVGKFKEAIIYLKKAESFDNYLQNDAMHKSRIYSSFATYYQSLDLSSLAIKNYLKSIEILDKKNNKNQLDLSSQSSNYAGLAMLYRNLGKRDSAYYYLNKEKNILKNVSFKGDYIEKSSSLVGLAYYHLDSKNRDSSSYFFQKSMNLLKGKNHVYEIDAFMGYAALCYEQKNYNEALNYYIQSLNLAQNDERLESKNIIYHSIAEVSEVLGNREQYRYYKKLSEEAEKKLKNRQETEIDLVVNQVVKFEKEQEQQKSRAKIIRISAIVALIIVIFTAGVFLFIKRKKNEYISESESLLKQKEDIILQKEEETQELKQKVNESFEEVIQLAKENKPEFLTRFQEVYPSVIDELKRINSAFRSTELTLCAYFYLGFNSKDIANYTFKSVYTIKARKANLRKKLNLDPKESIDAFIKQF